MALALEQLPNDVAALQAIITKQAKELDERAVFLGETELKARDVIIEQLQLNLARLKRSQLARLKKSCRLLSSHH